MTGGTIVAAIDLLKDRGVANERIKVVSAQEIVLFESLYTTHSYPFETIVVDICCRCPSCTREAQQEVPRVPIKSYFVDSLMLNN